MELSKSAKRKLTKLADFIRSIPRKNFDMGRWGRSAKNETICETNSTECGTACCIAGWAIVKSGKCLSPSERVVDKKGNVIHARPDQYAAKLLDLDFEEARALFFDFHWPHQTNKRTGYLEPVFKSTPKGAAKRIMHMVEHGE